MTLAPLRDAGMAIELHVTAALGAFTLGTVQLVMPKGTLPHRALGWIWVLLMSFVCISSFFIHRFRFWGPWSPIHLLSLFTLATLPIAVLHAHRHAIGRHRRAMLSLFFGALVIAGLLTLMPGRIMHRVIFG